MHAVRNAIIWRNYCLLWACTLHTTRRVMEDRGAYNAMRLAITFLTSRGADGGSLVPRYDRIHMLIKFDIMTFAILPSPLLFPWYLLYRAVKHIFNLLMLFRLIFARSCLKHNRISIQYRRSDNQF